MGYSSSRDLGWTLTWMETVDRMLRCLPSVCVCVCVCVCARARAPFHVRLLGDMYHVWEKSCFRVCRNWLWVFFFSFWNRMLSIYRLHSSVNMFCSMADKEKWYVQIIGHAWKGSHLLYILLFTFPDIRNTNMVKIHLNE